MARTAKTTAEKNSLLMVILPVVRRAAQRDYARQSAREQVCSSRFLVWRRAAEMPAFPVGASPAVVIKGLSGCQVLYRDREPRRAAAARSRRSRSAARLVRERQTHRRSGSSVAGGPGPLHGQHPPASRVLFRRAGTLQSSACARGDSLSARGLAPTLRDSLWRDHFVW